MPRIVVVGSINMDFVVRVPRLPVPGETVTGVSLQTLHGGKGANQAVAAARLGADVVMVGRIGGDDFGTTLREGLIREGIDCTQVTDCAATTGVAVITVADDGQNCITVIPGANGLLTSADVIAATPLIARADLVLLQLEVPMHAVLQTIEIARQRGVRIVLNPAPAVGPLPHDLFPIDVLCPNETEAALITGLPVDSDNDARQACARLRELGAGLAIITRGNRGVVWCDQSHQPQLIPAFDVPVVDTTAAGDAFAAALTVALAERQPVGAALRFASAAGALACTCHGAQPAMPRRETAEALVRRFD